MYKGKKEHLGRSSAQDLGLGISRNLFIKSLSVRGRIRGRKKDDLAVSTMGCNNEHRIEKSKCSVRT